MTACSVDCVLAQWRSGDTPEAEQYELAPVRVRVYPLYKGDQVCRVCMCGACARRRFDRRVLLCTVQRMRKSRNVRFDTLPVR